MLTIVSSQCIVPFNETGETQSDASAHETCVMLVFFRGLPHHVLADSDQLEWECRDICLKAGKLTRFLQAESDRRLRKRDAYLNGTATTIN
jgi:hypothetical protein